MLGVVLWNVATWYDRNHATDTSCVGVGLYSVRFCESNKEMVVIKNRLPAGFADADPRKVHQCILPYKSHNPVLDKPGSESHHHYLNLTERRGAITEAS